MHPTAVPTAYIDVFAQEATPPVLSWVMVGVAVLGILFTGFYCIRLAGKNKAKGKKPSNMARNMAVALTLLFGFVAVGAVGGHQIDTFKGGDLNGAIATNLHQKYGVTYVSMKCVQNSNTPDGCLISPQPYQLKQPNAPVGTFYVKWDRTTSEPTIIGWRGPVQQ